MIKKNTNVFVYRIKKNMGYMKWFDEINVEQFQVCEAYYSFVGKVELPDA